VEEGVIAKAALASAHPTPPGIGTSALRRSRLTNATLPSTVVELREWAAAFEEQGVAGVGQ
jgi:hypothetical protein